MKLFLAPMILLASPASAQEKPPRETGAIVTASTPMEEINLCISRLINRYGNAKAVPIERGTAFDVYFGGFFNMSGPSHMSIIVRDTGEQRTITVHYRHPLSRKAAVSMLEDLGKKCAPGSSFNDSSVQD